jgi:hypothetical protein
MVSGAGRKLIHGHDDGSLRGVQKLGLAEA